LAYDEVKSDIGALVRKRESDYQSGTTTISRYVVKSMRDDLDRIDAYINSKHISGETDSLNREKPFFNIVTAAINIWYRATDIDRSHIKIKATKAEDTTPAFLASVLVQDWMRRENYGSFLNEWGRVLARYGSAVVKHVEKGGRLIPMVVPWNRLIVDAVEMEGNPVIEIIELTEGQLYERKGYDKEQIEALCNSRRERQTTGGEQKDNLNEYIRLYEVHGLLPKSYLTGNDKDKNTYVQQMHVVSFVAKKNKGEYDDFTLVKGEEAKNPYMLTHLIKEDGQTLSIGAVQHLFDAQWMVNHSAKAIKDQLDLASKLIFQTSDQSFLSANALTSIETGDILIHKVNEPLTQINNGSHDIVSSQNYMSMWKALGNDVTGTSESMRGETAPSGTPWRQVDALLQENHSLFELMTENKGIHIEEMMRNYVIPFLKKKHLKTSKQISAILEEHDITRIDSKHIKATVKKVVNRAVVKAVIRGEDPTPDDMMMLGNQVEQGIKSQFSELGNQRFFKPSELSDATWADVLKDLEWEVEVDVTAESSNAKDDLVTLSTVFQTIADPAKQAVLATPDGKLLFNTILRKAGGVSPLQLSVLPPAQPQPMIPQAVP
jgi:hypothetical protein